jgi:diguanylate cyclase (GGDEF)-like protein
LLPLENDLDINQLEGMLTELKSCASLSPYSLTLYHRKKGKRAEPARFECCCSILQDPLCRDVSRQFFEKNLETFFKAGTPTVCRYGGGFFGFVIPLTLKHAEFCLIGDGVRDKSIDLWQLAFLSRQGGAEVFSLFPHVETLHIASFQEVNEVAREVAREVGKFSLVAPAAPGDPPLSEQTDTGLSWVADALEQLERAGSQAETISLCCRTIAAHFNLAGAAVALRETSGTSYRVSGICGLPVDLGTIPAVAIDLFISRDKIKKMVPFEPPMQGVLPALQAEFCTFFPLQSQDEHLGFIALVDTDLKESDLLLVSMLTNAAATRLSRIVQEEEQTKASDLSGRLMSLANTLLLVDNKEQLYEAILGIASDLTDATQGSIMLIDKNGEEMHIVFTQGMTLNIAKCLPMKVGAGIAGMVAQTGEPLLINDVEKDSRIAMPNRLRFKSKSLICVPLKLKEKIFGVLNLSDKKNLAPFSENDLHLLTSFANLASLMIERTLVLEESFRFEQLSVTDSLTGLYNRRFLKSRLEEELSRSSRQGLFLTVLFIDLDFFKSYNDVCGHLAGDEALKITADIIKASVREMDIVARYGGEEFCAVLPGTSKAEALIVAERIRTEIENKRFPGVSDAPVKRMTASLGVASFPEDGRTYTELVHASDVALYKAKATGRNRVVTAPTALQVPPSNGGVDQPPAENTPQPKPLDFNTYLEASLAKKGDTLSKNNTSH